MWGFDADPARGRRMQARQNSTGEVGAESLADSIHFGWTADIAQCEVVGSIIFAVTTPVYGASGPDPDVLFRAIG